MPARTDDGVVASNDRWSGISASCDELTAGVAVDQHVDIGLKVGEHTAHNMALAPKFLSAHNRSGCASSLEQGTRTAMRSYAPWSFNVGQSFVLVHSSGP
jgi:hypothetical protein